MELSAGKEVEYSIQDEDTYEQYFSARTDQPVGLERVYMKENISLEEMKDFMMYNYGDTHNPLGFVIPEEYFLADYKKIPAIADNDSIEEV